MNDPIEGQEIWEDTHSKLNGVLPGLPISLVLVHIYHALERRCAHADSLRKKLAEAIQVAIDYDRNMESLEASENGSASEPTNLGGV